MEQIFKVKWWEWDETSTNGFTKTYYSERIVAARFEIEGTTAKFFSQQCGSVPNHVKTHVATVDKVSHDYLA